MTKPRGVVDLAAVRRARELQERFGVRLDLSTLPLTREDFARLAERCKRFADQHPNGPSLLDSATIDDVLAVSPWYVRPPARAAIWLLKQRRRQELPR